MKTLALDVGTRRTGVAFLDDATGIPVPLDTLEHRSEKELLAKVREIISARGIQGVVVGLPKLPGGEEGTQAAVSRSIGEKIAETGLPVRYVDERFTTPSSKGSKHAPPASAFDGDAAAACELLR
jgi:putative Holliday junction resolvase